MFKEVLAHIDFAIFPCISLVLLSSFMAAVMIWVFRPRSGALYEGLARHPFHEPTRSSGHDSF